MKMDFGMCSCQLGADTLLLSDSNGDLQNALLPEHQGLGYGSSSVDLDSDGDIDIVVAAEQGGHFYENRLPQGFRLHLEADSTIDPQLDGRTQGWAIADYDRDGFFDLFGPTFYARYGFSSSNPPDLPFDNLIYKGIGDFQWLRKQGWSAYVEQSAANAGGWVDIDDDGDLDLFVISDKPDLFSLECCATPMASLMIGVTLVLKCQFRAWAWPGEI